MRWRILMTDGSEVDTDLEPAFTRTELPGFLAVIAAHASDGIPCHAHLNPAHIIRVVDMACG